ncbi:MAG: hypothetical protein JNK67_15710 [Alphaproteobacteria bacterium]|nr:hypothetical protein [Alphaproteobacteria bacterium]
MPSEPTKFTHPREILDALDLTPDEKIKLLRQMEYDLRDKLVASDENMTGTEPGRTGELLRQVRLALHSLGVTAEETGAPTKSGAG